ADLHERARAWVARCEEAQCRSLRGSDRKKYKPPPTAAYVDLLFAYGLTRIGSASQAVELVRLAGSSLTSARPVHALLYEGFSQRTRQAAESTEVPSDWPTAWKDRYSHLSLDEKYTLDRLRSSSRVLEPVRTINPYWHGMRGCQDLATLWDIDDDVQ